MTKKAASAKKKPGRTTAKRTAGRSSVAGVRILSDRYPPVENCHVVVQGDPPYGTCEPGGGARCKFPGVKVGGKVTQMILCETNGQAELFVQGPKKRLPRPTK